MRRIVSRAHKRGAQPARLNLDDQRLNPIQNRRGDLRLRGACDAGLVGGGDEHDGIDAPESALGGAGA